MITLPNGCSCSNITVNPKNWDKPGASVKKDWYIQYYFYDPRHKDKFPKGRLRIIKGMNEFKTLEERRYVTKSIITDQWVLLKEEGYNAITGELIPVLHLNHEIESSTPIINALNIACDKLKVSHTTLLNIKSGLKYIAQAIRRLNYESIPVEKFIRKYASSVLNHCYTLKKNMSGHTFNHYRSSWFFILTIYLLKLNYLNLNIINARISFISNTCYCNCSQRVNHLHDLYICNAKNAGR